MSWAERMGVGRKPSDTDTGWAGELAVRALLVERGFGPVDRPAAVKWPFDLLVSGLVRVDVKAAAFKSYGPCSGWFYRIGKVPQADIVALYRSDRNDCLIIPWALCPTSNITISEGGGKYAAFLNNYSLLQDMISVRGDELQLHRKLITCN